MESRFNYNPFTKEFFDGGLCHALSIHNKGRTKEYDTFIRGIISDNVLYLRTFYPFDDLSNLNYGQLQVKSKQLLRQFEADILHLIKREYNILIKDIVFNAENDLLKGILANI